MTQPFVDNVDPVGGGEGPSLNAAFFNEVQAVNSHAVRTLDADHTGLIDAGPALQAAYDDGATTVVLRPGGRYLIDTPVFFDSTDGQRKFVLEGQNAKLILGSNLPTVSDFTYDSTVRWALYSAIQRDALSVGVVTATGNRSTGEFGPMPPAVTIRDLTVDGQNANRGLLFQNYAASLLEGVTLWRARVLVSWVDYPDGMTLRNCRNNQPYGTDSYLIIQISNGDGVVLDTCQADDVAGIARLSQCNGATLRGLVGGAVVLSNSHGVLITGTHLEAQQSGRVKTCIEVRNSHVVIDGSEFWCDPANRWGAITINDTADEGHTDLVVRDTVVRDVYFEDTPDSSAGPFLTITAANPSTRVRFERVSGTVSLQTLPTYWRTGLRLRSAVTAVQSAFSAGGAAIASGSFELRRRGGLSGATWELLGLNHRGLSVTRRQTAPEMQVDVEVEPAPTGALTNGTTYEYAMAVLDASGNYSTAVSDSAVAGAAGALRLIGLVTTSPCRVVIWRKTGAGVLTAPDRYAVLPHDGSSFRFYDTGANINMVPWVTTSVPVPNTVAAVNDTTSTLLLDGADIVDVWSYPVSVDPVQCRSLDNAALAANEATYYRVRDGGTISKIALEVVTSSGNISVAAYRNSATGRAAVPARRLASSGAVACPAAGYVEVALSGTVTVRPGDWLAISADNATATFRSGPSSPTNGSPLALGRCYKQATAHPLPTTPDTGTLFGLIGRSVLLVGVA